MATTLLPAPGSAYIRPPLGGVASENQFGFPIESDDVLISTLIKIGITDVKEIDLQKPSQAVALACFTAFLELLSYVNEDVIDMLKRDSLEKLDNPDLYEESLHTVIRFREVRALMIASCVPDFSLADILRPRPKRFRKQMFALINFLRFSEHHIQHFDRLKEEADQKSKARNELTKVIASHTERIGALDQSRQSEEEVVIQLRASNAGLGDKLRSLKEEQSSLLNELEDAKQDKNLMHSRLLRLIESSRLLQEELERLKMRMENTPVELRTMIDKQGKQLQEKRSRLVEEESKAQSMHSKGNVLDSLESEISSCSTVVKECLIERVRLERKNDELCNVREDSRDLTREYDNLKIESAQLEEKLRWAQDRLDRLQTSIDSRREHNRVRKEQGANAWQSVQAKRSQRQEAVNSLTQELSILVGQYDQIVEAFDTFLTQLLKQKGQLESRCDAYMRALARKAEMQFDL